MEIHRVKRMSKPVESEFFYAMLCLVAQSCPTVCDPLDYSPPGSSVHADSPDKNTEVGWHALLQGIFTTQGLNPGLPHCRWILYQPSNKVNPRILMWVAFPFSKVSSWPKDQTQVSPFADRFFTSWATREAPFFFFFCLHPLACRILVPQPVPAALKAKGLDHWTTSKILYRTKPPINGRWSDPHSREIITVC